VIHPSFKHLSPVLIAAGLGFLAVFAGAAPARAADFRPVTGSVRKPDASGLAIGSARIVRTTLTPDELAAPMSFSVTLRMRDLAGLRARVGAGETMPFAELESRYLPSAADFERVGAWLRSQGFTPSMADRAHMTFFTQGTVAAVGRTFSLAFARVAVADGEYSSAVSDPLVPADLAGVVLSVNGLQPEFRLRPIQPKAQGIPRDVINTDIFVTPDNVMSAYAISPSLTGAGQTIAIVSESAPVLSDLTSFWTAVNSHQTTANLSVVTVNPPGTATTGIVQETALDVEWAGALAPSALLRDYVAMNALDGFAQILNDLADYPSLSVVSSSYGLSEVNTTTYYVEAYSQTMAALASQGVSILSASGDDGSNPDDGGTNNMYAATTPLNAVYPASDPSVTGVGGTTLTYNYVSDTAYTDAGEVVWNDLTGTPPSATGGGVSMVFAKPAWQTGNGSLLAGETMRCVPDVAALANANVDFGAAFGNQNFSDVGALIYTAGQQEAAGGTSLATPIWAAIAALVNQARAANGLGHIGLLNPYLYRYGPAVFQDVTSGTNGAYSAGPGYDLCTGIGTPDVAGLVLALSTSDAPAPSHRLVDVSTRAEVETGSNIVIAGFVLAGPSGSTKTVLVRGIGPALTAFGVTGALATPVVSVFDSTSVLIASDTGWGAAPVAGTSTTGATFRMATAADMSAVGAFALTADSADSAMVLTLPIGSYTVQVSGAGSTTGIALAEVYELSTAVPQILSNISARCFVGTGSQVAISGFVVEGNEPVQLLVRGIGPALSAFGLTGVLAQPSIALEDSASALIASDTGWGNAPVAGTSTKGATFRMATAADMAAVGAFALTAGSADSAIVVTVPAGSYTAVVSGVNSTSGTALAEVYELSSP
jgi:kumamolisin